jgi:hypothetical protein
MPRKFFQRFLPPKEQLQNHRHLQVLGELLYDTNLWHLNRQSAALAAFVGIFCAFMPIPMQMLLAAAIAVVLHANLPMAVVLVWISNPLTMPPIFFGTYKLGALLLDIPPRNIGLDSTLHEILVDLSVIWQPLLLGSLICGLLFGGLGYITVKVLWRLVVTRRWRQRLERNANKNHLS